MPTEAPLILSKEDKRKLDPRTQRILAQSPYLPSETISLSVADLWALDRSQRNNIARRIKAVYPIREIGLPNARKVKEKRAKVFFLFSNGGMLNVISGMGGWINQGVNDQEIALGYDSTITIWEDHAEIDGEIMQLEDEGVLFVPRKILLGTSVAIHESTKSGKEHTESAA